ncbi:MAG: ribbon-helix-helix protein, CopG family [Crenarchaeota archaeon]|nr:ribbon-helix-helix protein, CopG family [Thermoproteota archaeon]
MRVYTFKATEELMERLYRLARRQGISVGEAIRRAIAQYILAHEPLLVEKVLPI